MKLYSIIIILWSLLYYNHIVKYPPSKSVVILCLCFSTYLCIIYKIPLCYTFLSIVIHMIPLYLIDYESIHKKENTNILFYNMIIFMIYISYLSYFKIHIIDEYKQLSLFFSKNPSIEEGINKLVNIQLF